MFGLGKKKVSNTFDTVEDSLDSTTIPETEATDAVETVEEQLTSVEGSIDPTTAPVPEEEDHTGAIEWDIPEDTMEKAPELVHTYDAYDAIDELKQYAEDNKLTIDYKTQATLKTIFNRLG